MFIYIQRHYRTACSNCQQNNSFYIIIYMVIIMKIQRIRDLREDADLTQTEMGKILGLEQRTYAYYENGGRTIPIEILIMLADYYDVSVDYILGRTDNRKMNK